MNRISLHRRRAALPRLRLCHLHAAILVAWAIQAQGQALFGPVSDAERTLNAAYVVAEWEVNPNALDLLWQSDSRRIDVQVPNAATGTEMTWTLESVPTATPKLLVTLMSPNGLVDAFPHTPELRVFRLVDSPWNGFLWVQKQAVRGVLKAHGTTFEVGQLEGTRHALFDVEASPGRQTLVCGADSEGWGLTNPSSGDSASGARSDTLCVEFAVDIDHYTFESLGESVEECVIWGLGHLAGASEVFVEELDGTVEFRPVHCNIWVEPEPWADVAGNAGEMLNQLTHEWNNNPILSSIPRDLVHLFSQRWDTGVGGIAWLGTVCGGHGVAFSNSLSASIPQYPSLTWGLKTICHEIGHNFGSAHTHWCNWPGGPDHPNGAAGGTIHNCAFAEGGCVNVVAQEAGTIMSYCFAGPLEFHPVVKAHALLPAIADDACLGDCGAFPDPLNLLGCTDESSCNYDPDAMINDGSCVYPAFTYVDCDGACLEDVDDDGVCDPVDECVGPCLIPNVFTPNASRGNNVFPIRDLDGYDGSVLRIYNRMGSLVWSEASFPGSDRIVWDGNTASGNPCPEGVYFWVLLRSDGATQSGEVSLFRGG